MYVMGLGFGSDLFYVNCDQPFTFFKICCVLDYIPKKHCARRALKSVCFEVRGIRLVQDKGITLAL